MAKFLKSIQWDVVIKGTCQLFTLVRTEVQRHSTDAVFDHLRSLLSILISLLVVTLFEFRLWKKNRLKNDDKEAYFTLYDQLFTTFDRESLYTAGILLFSLIFSTIGLLQSLLYGAFVLFSFIKCSITLFLPLIDLINLLFIYQRIMNVQYTAYAELIVNGTSSVHEYSFIKPPVSLFISLVICLLRVVLSLYMSKYKFKSNNNAITQIPINADIVLEFILVILPYTSKNILSLARRIIIRAVIMKIMWALRDRNVQIWLLIKLVKQGNSLLINNRAPEKAFRWFFRGVQAIQNVPNSVTIWYILLYRFAFTFTTIFFMFCCIEEPSPGVMQFKLNTLKAKLVFFVTTPDILMSILSVALPVIYFTDVMFHFKKADTHGNLAFVWFLTGKDLRAVLDRWRNANNNQPSN